MKVTGKTIWLAICFWRRKPGIPDCLFFTVPIPSLFLSFTLLLLLMVFNYYDNQTEVKKIFCLHPYIYDYVRVCDNVNS